MSQTEEVKIVFTPSGRQGQVAKGTNLLQAARQLGVDVDLFVAAEPCVVVVKSMWARALLPNMASNHLKPIYQSHLPQRHAMQKSAN